MRLIFWPLAPKGNSFLTIHFQVLLLLVSGVAYRLPRFTKRFTHTFVPNWCAWTWRNCHHAGHVLVTFWTSWIVSMSQWPRWRTTSWEFLGCFCCRCVGQKLDAWGEVIDMICWGDTVDGRNPANQLISSLSHYIFYKVFFTSKGDCRISEPSIVW